MRKMRNVFALTVCALVLSCFSMQTTRAANFTVNTTTDLPDADTTNAICADANNQCSLRTAIRQISVLAEPNNMISFAAALLDQIVQLDSALPPLDRDTTISGLGVARLTINGNGAAKPLLAPEFRLSPRTAKSKRLSRIRSAITISIKLPPAKHTFSASRTKITDLPSKPFLF